MERRGYEVEVIGISKHSNEIDVNEHVSISEPSPSNIVASIDKVVVEHEVRELCIAVLHKDGKLIGII